MNYVQYFIDNQEKEFEQKNKPKKIFVFIVYMFRILKSDLNKLREKPLPEQIEINKKILVETLSNLSDYYQIFIDNLNGKFNQEMNKILVMPKKELFRSLIDPDETISSNIYKCLSYMRFNIIAPYKGITQENYVEKLMDFISNNKRLHKLINNCILEKGVNKNEDIISKVFKEKNVLTGEEIEIMSVIQNYLIKVYTPQLS